MSLPWVSTCWLRLEGGKITTKPKINIVWAAVALVIFFGVWNITASAALALTYEEERTMGREVLMAVRKHMKMVEDPTIVGYVEDLGRKVLQATGPQPFEYRFFVVQSNVMNAFAVPGGYVFVHSETLTTVQNEGQLASILAHEIAHVTQRHVANRLARGKTVSLATLGGILAGILIGGAPGTALVMGSMGGGIQAQLAYSREDEREADMVGLDYLVRAGYDPRFMAQSFNNMLRANYTAPRDVPTYLTTHPGLNERIGTVEAGIKAHPGYGRVLGRGDEQSFLAVRDRVMALLNDRTRARNFFEAARKKMPNAGSPHYGLALVNQREQDYDGALREFKLALNAEPANPGYLTDFGNLLYLKKDYPGAREALNKALVLRPNSPSILFLLGRLSEETGAIDQAQMYYERTIVQAPQHTTALQQLGVIYGQKGDMARAHLHTGLYFKTEGRVEKAWYHLKKAKESSGSAPQDVKNRIETALQEVEKVKKDSGFW